MNKRQRGLVKISYDAELNPTVEFLSTGEVLTGRSARKYRQRLGALNTAMYVVLLPVTLPFAFVMWLNRTTERILEKVMK